MADPFDVLSALATSALLGMLVGLERERNPLTKAGLRTFALICLLGAMSTLLAQALDSGWIVAAGLLLVGATVAGASFLDPQAQADDYGTTTIVAAAVVFGIGAMVALGHRQVAVATGVAVTALLYFKTELEGFSQRFTRQDLSTVLRFAVLTAVVLPLLPDRPLAASGPLAALNPRELWMMVVLVSGVSLAGYIAWRLTLGRHGLALTGLLGGLASSTATTLVAARHARDGTYTHQQALVVILLANAVMLARVLLVASILSPTLATAAASVLLPALALCGPALAFHWRRCAHDTDEGEGSYRNPAGLGTALAFAAAFGAVMVLAAWVREALGAPGLYALAALSGATDVDAITLSVARLHAAGDILPAVALVAMAAAVASNLCMKAAMVFFTAGRAPGAGAALGFLLPLAALGAGAVLHG